MIWFSLPSEPRRVFAVLVVTAFATAVPAQAVHATDHRSAVPVLGSGRGCG